MSFPAKFVLIIPVEGSEEILKLRSHYNYNFWHGLVFEKDYAIATNVSQDWVNTFFEGKEQLKERSLIIHLRFD